MRVLFELSHPKHYYQYRFLIRHFLENNQAVKVFARDKDVLLKILAEEKVPFIIPAAHAKTLLGKFLVIPRFLWSYLKEIKRFKPGVIISKASPYAVLMKPFFKGKVVITPDSEVVKITNKFVAPRSDMIITPANFTLNYGKKHKRVNGFFEECYLSPASFLPDASILRKYNIDFQVPFFIVRFISWNANHDVGQYGFNSEEQKKLVNLLQKHGKVYISAERKNIPSDLEPYLLKIEARDIHHVLYHASAYIGDSQTMATEAALLGTPSFRYNSFVGKNDMSNFILLEEKYGLLKNFNKFNDLCTSIEETLTNKNAKVAHQQKREVYFANKDDINLQILSIIKSLDNVKL